MVFSVFTKLYNHHHYLCLKHFHSHPPKSSYLSAFSQGSNLVSYGHTSNAAFCVCPSCGSLGVRLCYSAHPDCILIHKQYQIVCTERPHAVSHPVAISNALPQTLMYNYFCGHMFSILSDVYLEVEPLGHILTPIFNFLRN